MSGAGWTVTLLASVLLCTSVLLLASARRRLVQSLPILDGTVDVIGAKANVQVTRDDAGVPVVDAGDRADAAFGLGFVHAQERFFQMDVMRRVGAGELAEMFGKPLVEMDRRLRVHEFRRRAGKALTGLDPQSRRVLDSYTAGVNAGLETLSAAPLEYMLTRTLPQPWRQEDSLLVVYYMYILLQDSNAEQDFNLFLMRDVLPAALVEFLAPIGVRDWDAPMLGEEVMEPSVPPPDVIDLGKTPAIGAAWQGADATVAFRGSNAWAVAASRTGTGAAIVANDMHLALAMPTVFYRASMRFPDAAGSERRLDGVTLPGYPTLIAGSNGRVAWGFSNSAADTVDLVRLEPDGPHGDRYLTATGSEAIETRREWIRVRGSKPALTESRATSWGPIVRTTPDGARFAQLWIAHLDGAVNLGLLRLEEAQSVDDALDVSPAIGIPAQNLVVGDAEGRVGWTVAGCLPDRCARRFPRSSTHPDAGWRGRLRPSDYPRLRRGDGYVWTANARIGDGDVLHKLGYGYYLLGARARIIRDRLAATERADEAGMHALQMCPDAVFLHRWHGLLVRLLDSGRLPTRRRRCEAREHLARWDRRAARDSVAYRLVREFRDAVEALVFEPFVAAVRARHPGFSYVLATDQREGPLWELVNQRSMHLLNPRFRTWDELLDHAVDTTCDAAYRPGRAMSRYTWGRRNRLDMRHPMSRFFPLMGRWYDMAPTPLDGDVHTPLAQNPSHGPVMRMVVSPGREEQGILQMPGGQAGNPLSPYFGRGHLDWLDGTRSGFLPGPARYRLLLRSVARPSAA